MKPLRVANKKKPNWYGHGPFRKEKHSSHQPQGQADAILTRDRLMAPVSGCMLASPEKAE